MPQYSEVLISGGNDALLFAYRIQAFSKVHSLLYLNTFFGNCQCFFHLQFACHGCSDAVIPQIHDILLLSGSKGCYPLRVPWLFPPELFQTLQPWRVHRRDEAMG